MSINTRKIIPVEMPSGFLDYETEEVSDAKTEVADLIGQADYEDALDHIEVADRIVSELIEMGWRPTSEL